MKVMSNKFDKLVLAKEHCFMKILQCCHSHCLVRLLASQLQELIVSES